MNGSESNLIGVLERIAKGLGGLERIAECLCGTSGVPGDASVDPSEEVVLGFAEGRGSVRRDGRGVSVAGPITGIGGEQQGQVVLSWESLAQSEEQFQFRDRLKSPSVGLDEQGPIQEIQPITRVQGRWTFNDGSSLTAVGVGISTVATLGLGRHNAADAASLVVTSGTGRFEGASGLGTVVGSVPFAQGERFFNNPGFQVTQKTVHAFRLLGVSAGKR